ncbi:MAG: AAA family ATPase [Sedimenticolaceae bacterium]
MYEAFYKLAEDPFRLLPAPGICFPHRSCAKAWAYLRYALQRGEGIVVVTGPPGSGKTTLAERLLNELNPAKIVSVRLIANDLNATDLLRKLAYSFGLPVEGMDRAMLGHRIERYLIELEHSQRRALVLIDEAQTLSHQSLEAMRLLTDLQSRSRPVLQLFLLGQEELEGVMCAPGMTQFQQRVIASSRLLAMDLPETKAYLEYRLGFADWAGDPSIDGPAVMAIYRHSQGLPRHVNKICSRLLLHGWMEEKHALGEQDVLAVVQDLRDELLAPMNGEREAVATHAVSAFESVYELALVPRAQPAKTTNTSLHDAKNTLSQADVQAQQALGSKSHIGRKNAFQGEGQLDTPGHYFHGTGYPRLHRLRRWIHRMFRAPGRLVRRPWGILVRGAPLIRDSLASAGHEAVTVAGKGARMIGRWTADQKVSAKALKIQAPWASMPHKAAAGLGVVLVSALVLIIWNLDGGTPLPVADGRVADAGRVTGQRVGKEVPPTAAPDPSQMPHRLDVADDTADSAQLPGRDLLNTSVYRDLAISEAPAADGDGLLSEGRLNLSAGRQGVGLLAYPIGTNGDLEQSLLGKVTGGATGLLVGRAVQARSMDVWALAWAPQSNRRENEAPAGSQESRRIALVVGNEQNTSRGYVRFLQIQDSDEVSADVAVAGDEPVSDLPLSEEVKDLSEADPPKKTIIPTAEPALVVSGETEPVLAADDSGQVPPVERYAEVDELLALADAAIARDRLTRPADGSAYSYYQRVLAIDGQHEGAREGLDRIVHRYGDLARWALDHQELEKAESYVGRGLQVGPDNSEMLALRGKVDEAIEEARVAELAEAEQARLALEMRQAAQVIEPEVKQEGSFSRLMRFVDGFSD